MASEQAHQPAMLDIIAIAFVVESSLAVANDWLRIIMDYISPMLRRVSEANPAAKMRMGFITYATADTLPSPILCKRFFVEYLPVTKEMKDSPANLGIGSTNSGGTRGMAALEGLVAAIELFDILHSSHSQVRPNANHIFHIANDSPDSSLHPQWNDSALLDFVTWEDMPAELKKRSISYSTINLRHNLSRFPELHSAVAPGAPKEPWFPAKPLHSVLAGFPMSPQKVAKRPNDVHSTPDPKRTRLGPPASVEASPKAPTPNALSHQPKPSPILPQLARAQQPAPPAPQPTVQPAVSAPPQASPQVSQAPSGNVPFNSTNLMALLKHMEEQVRGVLFSLQEAKKSGNVSQAEALQQELNKKQATYMNIRRAFQNKIQQQAAAQAVQAIQAQNQAQQQTAGQNLDMPKVGPSVPTTLPETARPPNQPDTMRLDSQAIAAATQHGHSRSASASGSGIVPNVAPQARPPMTQAPQVTNAALAAQMQKMVDQQRRAATTMHPPPPQNMAAGISNMNLAAMKPPAPPGPHQLQPQPLVGGFSTEQQQHPAGNVSTPVWRGTLSFGGSDSLGNKKETVIWVVANTTNIVECRADTWPTTMTLLLTADPSQSLPDLQTWIKRHRPALCTFTPQAHTIPDPVGNEANFKSLISLLMAKGIYAAAEWTLPSGEQGKNILFFPGSVTSLGAACFPMTGIPDMPRVQQVTANPLRLDINNPEIRARLNAMTQEQREAFLSHLKSHRDRALQMQRQALLAQSVGVANNNNSMGINNNLGANNNGNGNNFMAVNAMNLSQQNQQQQQAQVQAQAQAQVQHTPQLSQANILQSGGYSGGAGMMSAMSLAQQQQQQAMMAAAAANMSRSGGPVVNPAVMRNPAVPPNFNHEMMQSFIQRNPDGVGGGLGMGQ